MYSCSRDDRAPREARLAFLRWREAAQRRRTPRTFGDVSVTVNRREATVTCALTGELDMAGVDRVRAALPTPQTGQWLVVDLSRLSFIDVSGVHLLVELAEHAAQVGSTLVVAPAQASAVRRVLDLCQAEQHFTTVDVADDAGPRA